MKVTLHGLDTISTRLEGFRDSLRRSVIRGALNEAAKPIAESMRSRLPGKTGKKGSTGALRNSIGLQFSARQGGRLSSVRIGPRTRMSMPRTDVVSRRKGLKKIPKGTPKHTTINAGDAIEVLGKRKKTVTVYNLKRTKGRARGKVQVNTPTRYAHLYENGFLHRRGTTITRVAPRSFVRHAWHQEGEDRALDRFMNKLAREVL